MTYNEWRDELKSNLLSVSESERFRVLDYYAEAYADRREAGFSEREIIQEFGAPYDAAQRILSENKGGEYSPPPTPGDSKGKRSAPPPSYDYYGDAPPYQSNAPVRVRTDYTWVFILLCILFAGPIFGLIMSMIGITIGFCVAPVAIIGSGVAMAVSAVGLMLTGSVAYGFILCGAGVVVIGVGVALCPLFFKLVTLMWTLFKKFFAFLKSLFNGKEFA